MSPSTMCLYSAASMLLRSMSAEAQSLGSRLVVALAVEAVAAAAREGRPLAARGPAARPPEARLVRAPRGLKFHPTSDADGAPLAGATRRDGSRKAVALSLPRAWALVVASLCATTKPLDRWIAYALADDIPVSLPDTLLRVQSQRPLNLESIAPSFGSFSADGR